MHECLLSSYTHIDSLSLSLHSYSVSPLPNTRTVCSLSLHSYSVLPLPTLVQCVPSPYTRTVCPLSLHSYSVLLLPTLVQCVPSPYTRTVSPLPTLVQCVPSPYTRTVCPLSLHSYSVSPLPTLVQCVPSPYTRTVCSLSLHSYSVSPLPTLVQCVPSPYTRTVCPLSLHSYSVSPLPTLVQCVPSPYTRTVCPLSLHSYSVSPPPTLIQCVPPPPPPYTRAVSHVWSLMLCILSRTLKRTYFCFGADSLPAIQHLRNAWYGFSKHLDIAMDESFICEICGTSPKTVICDGTMIGCRKDLLPRSTPSPQVVQTPIKGSKHDQRTLIKTKRARELLLQYSGYSKDRKRLGCPKELSRTEFRQLCTILKSDGFQQLSVVLQRLQAASTRRSAPAEYRAFLSEVARNSPACGLAQVAGNKEVIKILQSMVSACSMNIFSSENHAAMGLLQETAPVLTSFLDACAEGPERKIPEDILAVIKYIVDTIENTFLGSSHSHYYPPPDPASPFSYFPQLPQMHGNARYEIDQKYEAKDSDHCRKTSYGHPTLSPGIFTVFCVHGICYGYEIMRECESPRHPFQIFKTRFTRPTENIVYDNSCRLHIYCLNREPVFFQATRFFVDRFHWRGHVGCTSGYCLDKYPSQDIAQINSQINEQANAGLQRIKAQLSYMSLDNFIFHLSLFLAIKNVDIKKKLLIFLFLVI